MSLSLEKRIQIAKRRVSLIKKIDLNIDPYNSETPEEVTHNDVISKVSKMMKEELSPFNIFLGIERLSTKGFSTSWMNRNLIQMLIDPCGEGYENILKYYAQKAKEDFEEFYKKILLSDDCFEFKDFLSGSQPIWLISDEKLKSGLLDNDSMLNLVNMFQLKCDPEQKKRVIQIVSEILEDMDSILPF